MMMVKDVLFVVGRTVWEDFLSIYLKPLKKLILIPFLSIVGGKGEHVANFAQELRILCEIFKRY